MHISRALIIGTTSGLRIRSPSVRGRASDLCVYARATACGRFPHVRATSVIRRPRGRVEASQLCFEGT